MILTARRQRRVLADIRHALRHSDPRLVARFALFTRLTKDEEVPQLERVRAIPVRWARSALRRARSGHWRARRRPGRTARGPLGILRQNLGVALLIPLVAVLVSVVLTLGRGQPPPTCAAATAVHLRAGRQAYPPRSGSVPSCPAASISRMYAGRR